MSDPETATADQSDTVASDGETTASASPAPAEPEVQLTAKERRSKKRTASRGTEPRPARTREERTSARLEKRKSNADERRRYRSKSREKRRSSDAPGEGTPKAERSGTGSPRVLRGTVVSAKANKTITVQIDVARQHRTYGKIVRTSSKLSAHDERNEASAGDTVRVVESRPLSRSKRWRLVDVVEKAR
ncbi:MAG: 30S ribosomal protein S17 [Thermoleophilaceae bacterium]